MASEGPQLRGVVDTIADESQLNDGMIVEPYASMVASRVSCMS